MKIVIDAKVENTPLESRFEVDVPERYVSRVVLAGKAFSIIREALKRFEEDFGGEHRDSNSD